MWTWFHRLASPPHFYRAAGRLAPWFGWSATILIAFGLYGGLVWAPKDNEMGDGFRIIYVHVPSAWMSLCSYTTMAVAAAIGLIWRIKLAHAVAASTAVPGASFTFLALVTGSIWGKPMWGTWWVWDARMTSTLILMFLYIGFISLQSSIDDPRRADRAGAVLALVGVINVPIIYFSVQWWNTLHQGATLRLLGKPSISGSMLWSMLIMLAACWLYSVAVVLIRVRCIILEREQNAARFAEVTI